jgi:CBS domain containing-hemolysin-like protein
MIWIPSLLAAVVALLLIPICAVQVAYLASMRLRPRDTPMLEWFRDWLQDRLGYKLEEGGLAFSLLKHSLVLLMTLLIGAALASSGRPLWRWVIESFLISWFVMMTVAHLIPHLLYRRASGRWMKALLPLFLLCKQLMRPLVATLEFLESLADLNQDEESREDAATPAENIEALIEAGAEEGLIEEEDRALIQSVVEFGDKTAREVMTPRPNIVAISNDATFDQLKALMIREEYSRVPVFEGTIDRVVGFVHVRDVFKQDYFGRSNRKITSILRPIRYVPETKHVAALFREMQTEGSHMTMVADEYGDTAGLVTMEDVVEVILGEIHDEHEPTRDFVEEEPGVFKVSGNCDLDRVYALLGKKLVSQPESNTIGGLVMEWLGHVPELGERVEQEGLTIEVLAADDRRVSQVRVHMTPPEPERMPDGGEEESNGGKAAEKE